MITLNQENEVVRLYQSHRFTIKEIIAKTGVKSEQTIYRILARHNVPKIRKRKPVRKVSISLDETADTIIRRFKPKNLSEFICEMIKKGCPNR